MKCEGFPRSWYFKIPDWIFLISRASSGFDDPGVKQAIHIALALSSVLGVGKRKMFRLNFKNWYMSAAVETEN